MLGHRCPEFPTNRTFELSSQRTHQVQAIQIGIICLWCNLLKHIQSVHVKQLINLIKHIKSVHKQLGYQVSLFLVTIGTIKL